MKPLLRTAPLLLLALAGLGAARFATAGDSLDPSPSHALASPALGDPDSDPAAAHAAGLETITLGEVKADITYLASPTLGGRDSPSAGLDTAAQWVAEQFQAAGLVHAPSTSGFLWNFAMKVHQIVPEGCSLATSDGEQTFALGTDFVPVPGCNGEAEGELVFAGFGILSKSDGYNDLGKSGLRGNVVMILEGEPRHPKKFDGLDEHTEFANLYNKLADLEKERVAGVIVVRRLDDGKEYPEGEEPDPAVFGVRHQWATWVGADGGQALGKSELPVIEITPDTATTLLGEDVLALAAEIDRSAKPVRRETGRSVKLSARMEPNTVNVPNVVGMVRGTDLADEYVIVGAHLDHVGVDVRGRIGYGADDNASGTSAMIEVAEALAIAKPRRSVLCVAFGGEEKGLLGSAALAEDPPVAKDAIVAMVNLDMIGRGPTRETFVLGIKQNPKLAKLLKRAQKLGDTGLKKVQTKKAEELFERSDHYSFHKQGIPSIFFFEDSKISQNKDYHTWRDTVDLVDMEKVHNTARMAFNTVWLLATDDDRPPAPKH